MITSQKWQKLHDRMLSLKIHEADLKEKFILASGHGGQKVQKTSSCVYLKHLLTGIEIKCQESRLRETNRYYARKRLCDRMDNLIHQEASEQQKAKAKIRHQKKRRSRRTKAKMLEEKRARGDIKQSRKPPALD